MLLIALGLAAAAPAQRARGEVDGALAGALDRALRAVTAALPACDAGRAHCLGLQLHVAVDPGGGDHLIAQPDWVALQLATANRHFGALGVGFQVVGIDTLPAGAAHIATREDRDAVAEGRLTGKVIHVFITGELDDIDQPGEVIRGVTWHTIEGRKYVILSTLGVDRVLAHELGHVFGLPHSRYAISIMNKSPRTQPPAEQRRFADPEIAAMRPVLQRLLRDQVVADLRP